MNKPYNNMDKEITDTINKTISLTYDMLKENDGIIHRSSILEKLYETELYYDPDYVYHIFDSVDNDGDNKLSLDEFTNFYHILNNKGKYDDGIIERPNDTSRNKNNESDDYTNLALGFVIVGLSACGALYMATKIKK